MVGLMSLPINQRSLEMPRFQVELEAVVGISITVIADSDDEAKGIAESVMENYSETMLPEIGADDYSVVSIERFASGRKCNHSFDSDGQCTECYAYGPRQPIKGYDVDMPRWIDPEKPIQ
jgi:hypothetical protein